MAQEIQANSWDTAIQEVCDKYFKFHLTNYPVQRRAYYSYISEVKVCSLPTGPAGLYKCTDK